MNNGRDELALQLPWPVAGELASAMWATWWLWYLQLAHSMNTALLTLAAGSCAGSLRAVRSVTSPSEQ